MSNYAVINLKTDPNLKNRAVEVANRLGISISSVLNNELRRFATEQSVVFDVPETLNIKTAKQLATSKKQINRGNYYKFESNEESLKFLTKELK